MGKRQQHCRCQPMSEESNLGGIHRSDLAVSDHSWSVMKPAFEEKQERLNAVQLLRRADPPPRGIHCPFEIPTQIRETPHLLIVRSRIVYPIDLVSGPVHSTSGGVSPHGPQDAPPTCAGGSPHISGPRSPPSALPMRIWPGPDRSEAETRVLLERLRPFTPPHGTPAKKDARQPPLPSAYALFPGIVYNRKQELLYTASVRQNQKTT